MDQVGNAMKDVAKAYRDACQRVTGKSVEEWEAEWSSRRTRAFRDRKLNGAATFTTMEVVDAIRFYDLDLGDFQKEDVRAAEDDLTPFERAGGPMLVQVTRYRLRQEALKRIAIEAGVSPGKFFSVGR